MRLALATLVDALKHLSTLTMKIVFVTDRVLAAYKVDRIHTHLDTFLLPFALYSCKTFFALHLICFVSVIYKIAQDNQKRGTEM